MRTIGIKNNIDITSINVIEFKNQIRKESDKILDDLLNGVDIDNIIKSLFTGLLEIGLEDETDIETILTSINIIPESLISCYEDKEKEIDKSLYALLVLFSLLYRDLLLNTVDTMLNDYKLPEIIH